MSCCGFEWSVTEKIDPKMFDDRTESVPNRSDLIDRAITQIERRNLALASTDPHLLLGLPVVLDMMMAVDVVSFVEVACGQHQEIAARSIRLCSSSLQPPERPAAMQIFGFGYPVPPTSDELLDRMVRTFTSQSETRLTGDEPTFVELRCEDELYRVRCVRRGPLVRFDADLIEYGVHVAGLLCNIEISEPLGIRPIGDVRAAFGRDGSWT
jgi:hypothetical protein